MAGVDDNGVPRQERLALAAADVHCDGGSVHQRQQQLTEVAVDSDGSSDRRQRQPEAAAVVAN